MIGHRTAIRRLRRALLASVVAVGCGSSSSGPSGPSSSTQAASQGASGGVTSNGGSSSGASTSNPSSVGPGPGNSVSFSGPSGGSSTPGSSLPGSSASSSNASGLPAPTAAVAQTFAVADPNNPSAGVVAALGDGIVVAGATSDPTTAGLTSFDGGVKASAYVARVAHDGSVTWTTPLGAPSMPRGIGVDGSGNVFVVAAMTTVGTTIENDTLGTALYFGEVTSQGTKVVETTVTIAGTSDVAAEGLALDSTGAIYVAGACLDTSEDYCAFLTKLDATGAVTWSKVFSTTSSNGMSASAVAVTAQDDVVFGGNFSGQVNFGGMAVSSVAGFGADTGFAAGYSSAGDHLWDLRFADPNSAFPTAVDAIAAVGNDVIISGVETGTSEIGGVLFSGAEGGTPFAARIDPTGTASWAKLLPVTDPQTAPAAIAVDASGHAFVTGTFGGSLVLVEVDGASGDALSSLSADVIDAGMYETDLAGVSLAVDAEESVWLFGTYQSPATIGAVSLPATDESLFLVRADPGGS